MTWSERFAAYMNEHDIDRAVAAAALDVSETTIHYWMHGATARRERRQAVEKWTKGAVPANAAKVAAAAPSGPSLTKSHPRARRKATGS